MNLGLLSAFFAGDPVSLVLNRHCAIQALMVPVSQIVWHELKTRKIGRMEYETLKSVEILNLSHRMTLLVWGKTW